MTNTDYRTTLETKHHNGRLLSPLTVKSHIQTIEILKAWYQATYNESLDCALLTNYDLLAFRAWSINVQRVAAATWNVRRAGLMALCSWIGDSSLMDDVRALDPKEVTIRWMDDAEYGRLMRKLERLPKEAVTALEYQRSLRDRAMISLMLFAGLRVSEVVALTVSDVEINERSGKVLVLHGKGDKRSELPLMNPVARKWIAEWISAAGLSGNVDLFGVTARTAQRSVTDIGAQAGVAGLSAHDLRHTYLKRTVDGKNSRDGQRVSLEVVKKLARHSRIETTLRYVEPSWAEMQDAVGGMEAK